MEETSRQLIGSLSTFGDLRKGMEEIALGIGIPEQTFAWLYPFVAVALVYLVAYACTALFRYAVQPVVLKVVEKTEVKWDDYLFNERMLRSMRRMIPPMICYVLFPLLFPTGSGFLSFLLKVCSIYLVIVSMLLICTFFRSLYDISVEHQVLRNRPLKGVYQMSNLLAFILGAILVISIIMDTSAVSILAGLGASAAVLMLIFKDTILGLVAGLQLTANDMLRPDDWITMEKYGANGYVKEVTLTTVKVQNFDNTITTIPPYSLVSESFQNWRGMWQSGGRRMKLSIHIDANTVRFCTAEELEHFAAKGYVTKETASADHPVVNTQAYRDHILRYLNRHPDVKTDYLSMVRMLQPTPEGLPLELYCFCRHTVWKDFERFQSQVLDYALVMAPVFGLRIYQRLAGSDIHSV